MHSHELVPTGRSFDLYDRMGLRLLLDKSSLVDAWLISTGTWELEQIDRIKNAILAVGLLPGKKVFLDVGSYSASTRCR